MVAEQVALIEPSAPARASNGGFLHPCESPLLLVPGGRIPVPCSLVLFLRCYRAMLRM